MTETSIERVNGHAEPKVNLLKFAPEPAPQAPAAVEDKPQARRRVRIAHLRRIVVEARSRDSYKAAVRHGSYLVGGTRILTRRAWDARTTAMHSRMMRAAEAAGNEELVRQWEQRAYAYRLARHKRRMDLLQMALNAPKAIASAAVGAGSLLLVLGVMLAVYNHDVADVLAPVNTVVELVGWVAFIAGVVWEPLLYSLPALALASAWGVGRQRQTAPAWALPADAEDRDVVPDEGAILRALGNLGIAPLNKAIKDGWQPRWVSPTTRSGNGWHTQLQLPMGVTVEMIAGKKSVLAHNLLRKPVEVWPTEPPKLPGVLDLWVADQGSLSGAVPAWPLLTEGTTDYFKGVPVAVSQRGEAIIGKLMAANWMVGGIMGSGKTSIVIALLLGAILDPLVIVEAYVMAYNVDYDPLKPRMRVLVKGDEDEDLRAALVALRNLRDEVTERGKLLEELGGDATKLTRELALRDPRMRPKVVVFDEVHELFGHKEYGKEAAELAVKVLKKARKVGITLVFVTVSPTADSIPRDVTRNTSHRVAFAVGDHVANDGLLGSGKHKAGITATTLIPGEDVGTAVTVGFSSKPFEVVRSHYVARDPEKGIDEVTPVVERAMALHEGGGPEEGPTFEPADPLADVAAVLGNAPRMLTQEVLNRLAERRPDAYLAWGPADLKKALEPFGAEPYKSGGKSTVARDRVQDAILERLAEDSDDEGGDED
ncbi:zonular occludens toxin domain-containing protein [Streptomyces scabiei]|uniref:zonular occludens toxin domain-containing protein n=1 Tax=Streptomyces scabiei TaxID=1930 RepID=UPI001B338724|nr:MULTISPECIES: zonular occludens toxin domain-containing protein [Streptomyces]MBP5892812.1 cell division protein FtsK [Streptomyces sp. LBUM 1481]MBP5923078.1 cell division protein FtsK [Streptomyces sp. LBUM 1483]MDX2686867.1 cell division protein FtsK [Streptomyces scabiei]MDX2753077.1 cell division protein FtsK [Streptomyces scabiei]MDX2807266.1 cell division protein FtsK [Streptomyces scabiei]